MTGEEQHSATLLADGGVPVGDHGPELLGLGAEGWVYVGLTIFILIAIFFAKAPQKIAAALDARIDAARRALDEALAIRAEAEALLSAAKAKSLASAGDAEAIIAHAHAEAEALLADAKYQATLLTERRAKMAEDKIEAAQRSAIADIRAHAARAAAAAAGQVIAATHDASTDKALVDAAIARLN